MQVFKPEEKSPPLLVNIREAARLLGVSQRTIFQLVAEGRLPSVRIGSKGVRYSYRALVAFADNQRTATE